VVVDKFNKMCVLIPYKMTMSGKEAMNSFFGQVWMHFGIPRSIISKRDVISQCILDYIFGEDGHKRHTTFHPQTDGKTKYSIGLCCDF